MSHETNRRGRRLLFDAPSSAIRETSDPEANLSTERLNQAQNPDSTVVQRESGSDRKTPTVRPACCGWNRRAALLDTTRSMASGFAADAFQELVEMLSATRFVALTGAGCSTESGIPDYRSEGTLRRARNPVQYRAFVSDERARRRYWARSMLGWPRLSAAMPNPAHLALADLEAAGSLVGVITQNVDCLHRAAGSRALVELHGNLARVTCLACQAEEDRSALQERLLRANPGLSGRAFRTNPDGDAELDDLALHDFEAPCCRHCGSNLVKPGVVFFGEAVPRARVEQAHRLLERAQTLLVIGSSLAVFSGFRFVRKAAECGIAVAIVNQGPTRGDALARIRLEGRAGQLLPRLARALNFGV
jgi:NAD-dependent SIR2 family protein deacetylase